MAGKPKLTVEEINKRISSHNVKLIGEYTSNNIKTEFSCLTCKHEWLYTPKLVFRGIGCPKCSLQKRRKGAISNNITNQEIDDRLISEQQTFIRKGNYTGVKEPLLWQCNICNHEWNASVNNVFHRHTGCPKCSAKDRVLWVKKTIEWIVNSLNDRQITLLDTNYKDAHSPLLMECQVCTHRWNGRTDTILNSGAGCPKCSKKRAADQHMGAYNFELFTNYPELKELPGRLYVYKVMLPKEQFYKIGITKQSSTKKRINGKFAPSEYSIEYELICSLYEAFLCEQLLLNILKPFRYFPRKIFDGRTECIKTLDIVTEYLHVVFKQLA